MDTRVGGEVGDRDGPKFLAWRVKWMVLPFADLGNTDGGADCSGVMCSALDMLGLRNLADIQV